MLLAVPKNRKQELEAAARLGEEKIRAEQRELSRLKFLDATNLKGIYYRIGHNVDLALKAYDDDLEKKRNLLKSKLLEDQSCLTFEYVEKAQHHAEKLYEAKKKRAHDIVEAHEKDRLDYVNEMLDRQKMSNCDEYRRRRTDERNRMVAKSQLLQVAEKEALRAKEDQIEKMYSDLTSRDDSYNLENATKRKQVVERAMMDDILKLQITAKEYAKAELESLKEEEKMVLKMDKERMAEEDRLDAERKCKKKENLKKVLLDQVMASEEVRDRRNKYERELDDIIFEALKKEGEESTLQACEDRNQLAKELLEYHHAWKELDEYKKHLDQEDERVINEHKDEITHDVQENRDRLNAAKRRAARESYVSWAEQIKTRQKREDEEKDVDAAQKQLNDLCMIDIDTARIRQRCDDAKQNQRDIQTQMAYNELVKKRNKEHNLKLEQDMLDFHEAQHHDCVRLDDAGLLEVHPFYCALQCDKIWKKNNQGRSCRK